MSQPVSWLWDFCCCHVDLQLFAVRRFTPKMMLFVLWRWNQEGGIIIILRCQYELNLSLVFWPIMMMMMMMKWAPHLMNVMAKTKCLFRGAAWQLLFNRAWLLFYALWVLEELSVYYTEFGLLVGHVSSNSSAVVSQLRRQLDGEQPWHIWTLRIYVNYHSCPVLALIKRLLEGVAASLKVSAWSGCAESVFVDWSGPISFLAYCERKVFEKWKLPLALIPARWIWRFLHA